MNRNRVVETLAVVTVMLACVSSLQATVVIETVPVGNPGNADDTEGDGYGGVGYEYNIGKFEVTAGQYTEFLNAVATTDTYGLYSTSMDSEAEGCQITRNGSSGNYTYDFSGGTAESPGSTAADWADRPVNYVSWGDAVRFANWLANGQSTGAQDLSTTEDGSYFLNGATSDAALLAVNREADATWVIPTQDEWYKVAYYDPTDYDPDGPGGTDPGPGYWDYPTSSDTPPDYIGDGQSITNPDPGNYATYDGDLGTDGIGSPYYRTEIGEHENSGSPYGTFDQAGNVWEVNEEIFSFVESFRGLRGGAFNDYANKLHASYSSSYVTHTLEYYSIGFRVSEVPEPGSMVILALGSIGLLRRRRKLGR